MNKERMEKIKKILDKENIDYEWEILEMSEEELRKKTKELLQIDQVDLILKYLYQEQRINKAIEYIWSTKYEWGDLDEDNEDFDIDVYKLLDILEGGNNDK